MGTGLSTRAYYVAGLAISVGAVAAEALSGPGYRAGLWGLRTGFSILRFSAYAAILSTVLSLACIVFYRTCKKAVITCLIAIGLSAAAIVIPVRLLVAARTLPAIHGITADTDDPPGFVAVMRLRKDAANAAEYGGPEIARLQKEAYPDIRPLLLDVAPGDAFQMALNAANALGWEVAAADRDRGVIEATDTTFWYGFKDDVAVRVTPDGLKRSRLVVRSVSRVGKSDLGMNAKRIRRFLRLLSDRNP